MSDDSQTTRRADVPVCPRCGAARYPGEYCLNCGLPPDNTDQEPPTQAAYAAPFADNAPSQQRRSGGLKSPLMALLAAGAVLIVAVIAAIWVFGFRSSSSAASTSSSTTSSSSSSDSPSSPSTAQSSTSTPSAPSPSSSAAPPPPATVTITQQAPASAGGAAPSAETVSFPSNSQQLCWDPSQTYTLPTSDAGVRTEILKPDGGLRKTTCTFTGRVASAVRSQLANDPSLTSFSITAYSDAKQVDRSVNCTVSGGLATCTVPATTEHIWVTPTAP